MLDNPELALTEEGYSPPPEGCPLLPDSARPVLPMPWDRIVETYIPPGQAIPEFDLDYEVAPLAAVETISVTFAIDPRTQPANTSSSVHCPTTLAPTLWAPDSITNDVVRVRVAARDGEAHGRYADLFSARGTRTVSVPLAGLDLSSTDPEEHWFVAFEPAVGEARLALASLPTSPGSAFEMDGLPDGAARLIVMQTASVITQPESTVLHAPAGFASGFNSFSRGWYQAVWWPSDPAPTQLTTIVPPNTTARYAQLGEPGLSWNTSDAPTIVGLSGQMTTGTIAVECGASARLVITGFATVDLSVNGGVAAHLEPGDVATPSTACVGGATASLWSLSATSLNGRRSDVVVGGAL